MQSRTVPKAYHEIKHDWQGQTAGPAEQIAQSCEWAMRTDWDASQVSNLGFAHPETESEFRRWAEQVGPEDHLNRDNHLTSIDVLRAHFLIVDFFAEEGHPVWMPGPRDDLALLESAVGRQVVSLGNVDKWSDDLCIVGTLFFGLVKNHAFHDGNKRTAILSALYHLHKCGRTPKCKSRDIEALTLHLAGDAWGMSSTGTRQPSRSEHCGKPPLVEGISRLSTMRQRYGTDGDVHFLAWWFRQNTRTKDQQHRAVTFAALDSLLRPRGFGLGEIDGNHIDVLSRRLVRRNVFLRPREAWVKIGQVGCHRKSAQVSRGVLAEVRRLTGLTEKNGCDSAAFFEGLDDMKQLLGEYQELLIRLRSK